MWSAVTHDAVPEGFSNHDASYVVSGPSAKADILRALQELNERGATLPIPPALAA